MRKHIRLLTLLLATQFFAWFVGSAQQDPFESLPDGFPVDDVTYLGNYSFTSETFGDFQIDPTVKNRVIHGVLGPFIWSWDETTKIVTLTSEWWGPLKTCWPADIATAGLGFSFPYFSSDYAGATYLIDPTGSTSAPFFNMTLDANNNPVGWQSAIGVSLNDASSYYGAAQTMITQMQQQVAAMQASRDELAALQVQIGNTNIEQKREQVIGQFQLMDELYVRFLFFRHRLILAPQWVSTMGGDDAAVTAAQNWVAQLPDLDALSLEVYAAGQTTLFVETETLYATKLQQRTQLEQAQNSSGSGSSGSSNEGGPASGGTLPGAGSSPENPIIMGPMAWDVMSWPKTISLKSVTISNGRINFPCSKDYWKPIIYKSQTKGDFELVGNVWVIQKVGDKYYCANLDYFREDQYYKSWPRVFEHGVEESGIWYMSYIPGGTYWCMVSTLARRSYRTTNERSNIVKFTAQ